MPSLHPDDLPRPATPKPPRQLDLFVIFSYSGIVYSFYLLVMAGTYHRMTGMLIALVMGLITNYALEVHNVNKARKKLESAQ